MLLLLASSQVMPRQKQRERERASGGRRGGAREETEQVSVGGLPASQPFDAASTAAISPTDGYCCTHGVAQSEIRGEDSCRGQGSPPRPAAAPLLHSPTPRHPLSVSPSSPPDPHPALAPAAAHTPGYPSAVNKHAPFPTNSLLPFRLALGAAASADPSRLTPIGFGFFASPSR